MTDKELKKFCLDFREGILDGDSPEMMCFAVSAPLQALLYICGYETEMKTGYLIANGGEINHVWLELSDGRIIDATADQFNESLNLKMPKVYIGEKPEHYLV